MDEAPQNRTGKPVYDSLEHIRGPVSRLNFKRPEQPPVQLTVGASNVFIGPEDAKAFSPPFIEKLVGFWQEKFGSKPVTYFFNMHGATSPAAKAEYRRLIDKADFSEPLYMVFFDALISTGGRYKSEAVTIRDKDGKTLACAMTLETSASNKARLTDALGVAPEQLPFSKLENDRSSMAHEAGHCGTAQIGKAFYNENIADKFMAEFAEKHPEFFSSFTRKHQQQIRSVALIHEVAEAMSREGDYGGEHMSLFSLKKPGQTLFDLSQSPNLKTIRQTANNILKRAIEMPSEGKTLTEPQKKLLSDPRRLAQTINRDNGAGAFSRDDVAQDIVSSYLDGIKTFYPSWLPEAKSTSAAVKKSRPMPSQ